MTVKLKYRAQAKKPTSASKTLISVHEVITFIGVDVVVSHMGTSSTKE